MTDCVIYLCLRLVTYEKNVIMYQYSVRKRRLLCYI